MGNYINWVKLAHKVHWGQDQFTNSELGIAVWSLNTDPPKYSSSSSTPQEELLTNFIIFPIIFY